jgi:hypothetical protein
MSSPEDNILAKEIESWKGFEYALRQQNAKPFNQMLKEYWRVRDNLLPQKAKDHDTLQSQCLWLKYMKDKSLRGQILLSLEILPFFKSLATFQ